MSWQWPRHNVLLQAHDHRAAAVLLPLVLLSGSTEAESKMDAEPLASEVKLLLPNASCTHCNKQFSLMASPNPVVVVALCVWTVGMV